MSDWRALAEEVALDWRESRDQIERMKMNPARYSSESVRIAERRLTLRAKAVHVIRVVADSAVIQELVSEQLQARGKA